MYFTNNKIHDKFSLTEREYEPGGCYEKRLQ